MDKIAAASNVCRLLPIKLVLANVDTHLHCMDMIAGANNCLGNLPSKWVSALAGAHLLGMGVDFEIKLNNLP